MKFIKDCKHIARGYEYNVGSEIGDQVHLPLCHPARHRYHGHTESLGTVMEADATGEYPVAGRVLHQHSRLAAGGPHGASHQAGPSVEIAAAVPNHGWLAGRS